MTVRQSKRERKNLNPHAEAIAAMYIWGAAYSKQNGGSMDFWARLPDHRKRVARELIAKIKSAHGEGMTADPNSKSTR